METAEPAQAEEPLEPVEEPEQDLSAENVRQLNQGQTVINNFFREVEGAVFGVDNSGGGRARRRGSGPISVEEITRVTRSYVAPGCYAEARETLVASRVVALTGPQGTGRRTGAINLLHGLAEHLIELAPSYTLEELAGRDYRQGYGYLLCGWAGARLDREVTDFHVRALETRIKQADAHLVITGSLSSPPPMWCARWERPAAEAVLTAYGVPPEVVAEAAALLTADSSMADLVELARRLASGADLTEAVDKLSASGRQRVAKWFAGPARDAAKDFELAAMLFTYGLRERVFEELLARLTTGRAAPAEVGVESQAVAESRRARLTGDSLFTLEQQTGRFRGQQQRRLRFHDHAYRRYVVSELWDRCGPELWEPIAAWLDTIVTEPDFELQAQLAHGIALLAAEDYDYVEDRFLLPWAGGGRGWAGQVVAAHVLSWMCLDDLLGPIALKTAIDWTRSSSVPLRATAAFAFSGELGARYPTEAVQRLGELLEAGGREGGSARVAFAQLFATLTTATGNAVPVLRWLLRRLAVAPVAGTFTQTLLRTAVGVLEIRDAEDDGQDGEPIAARHLRERPAVAEPLARLWAAVLVNRPHRKAAMAAFHQAVCAFDERSERDCELVERLFAELARALSVRERRLFVLDFRDHVMVRDSERERLAVFLRLLHLFFDVQGVR
ncbi:hypothetical protein [Nonomuraea sp. NPDC050310]|uniref:hypothetical protein n=1 Tax=Nonomuraea sp. NPDC050310 TaxID=3154935 RepID=UPI0033EAEB09